MNLAGVIRLALTRIWSNKIRSALTILGVVIGVGALVGLVSIVQAATTGISSSLDSLGGSNLSVSSAGSGTLTEDDADALREIDGVATVASTVSGQGTASRGDRSASVTIDGVSVEYPDSTTIDIEAGSFLPQGESLRSTRTAVLSATAADDLGITAADIGTSFQLNGRTFTAIGILAESTGFGGFGGGTVYISLETARTMFAAAPEVDSITVVAAESTDVDGLVDTVTAVLSDRHNVA